MKILIEGYSYLPEAVRNVLPEKRLLLTDEKVTIENVGCFLNPECDDFVFFLPKVLLEQDEQKSFLYEFAVWIYRAIAQFKERNRDTTAVWEQKERIERDNNEVFNLLKTVFYIIPCELGEDPSGALQTEAAAHPIPGAKRADASESVVVATGYAKGYLDAIRTNGICPWDASSSENPLAVQMFVFPHTNQADVFTVNPVAGVKGPMPPEKVKADFPEFADIELPFQSYYAWPVVVPDVAKSTNTTEE